jgi:hypothetical protein
MPESFRTIQVLPSSLGKRFPNPMIGDVDQNIIRTEHQKLLALAAAVCGVDVGALTYELVEAKTKELLAEPAQSS